MDEEIILQVEPSEEVIDLSAEAGEEVIDLSQENGEEEISIEEESSFVNLDYNFLFNKPTINGVEVIHDKSIEDYGMEEMTNLEVEEMMQD